MSITRNLTLPGNPRYQPKSLVDIFGYDNLYQAVAEVEIATLDSLCEIGVIPAEEAVLLTPEVRKRLIAITTTKVDEVESKITKHDIRAWVRLAQEIVDPRLRRWIHVPLTSYDALDTARSLQFFRAYDKVLRPAIKEVLTLFAGLVEAQRSLPQIGRTHGQHALPVTVGFWLATILERLHTNAVALQYGAQGLAGKISGAVGAYNAQQALGLAGGPDGPTFEQRVLAKLGLRPAAISTQILPPEPLANYLFACTLFSAALGQFGRDSRHLMRSEIGELAESFEEGQVGSSTMAHKRNPITFENLEGMWLRTKSEFGKVLDTLISEHQRDLVGSSLYRDLPIIVVNLTQQLETLLRKDGKGLPFIARLTVDSKACARNLAASGGVIMAEPLYIALQMAGYEGDAHEMVNRQAVPASRKLGVPLVEVVMTAARDDEQLRRAWEAIPESVRRLLADPVGYVGLAEAKSSAIATLAREYATNL